jgi:PAS domain S-box-containing protein
MKKNMSSREKELIAEIKILEDRLYEAEQTIQAIRGGEVDALIIDGPVGEQLYTLSGADYGYRVLVESINEGALILSPDDSIYYCNHRFGEMLQVPIRKIIGMSLDAYIVAEARSEVTELIRKSRNCGTAEGEFQMKSQSGMQLPIKLSLNCVHLEEFHGVCAVLTDLSLRKRTEEELRKTAEMLRRSNKELQDFAFIASHDLQEPLRKIQTFGSRLERTCKKKLDESELDCLTRMQNSAKRMQQFIHDLLDYSRLVTREDTFGAVDLREIADETVANLELRIRQVGAIVEISDLPSTTGEPGQIQKLFQNIIANSLTFRREEQLKIKIHSRHSDKECLIFFEDNGIGFDETYLDRIFVPFQRLHGRSAYEGTGMGLALCRRIVERHGGSITAKSTPGEGSTFIVTLPAGDLKNGEVQL